MTNEEITYKDYSELEYIQTTINHMRFGIKELSNSIDYLEEKLNKIKVRVEND